MAKSRDIVLHFPLAGVVKRTGYQWQSPYSTPGAENVWPYETTEGRERGGQRAGLTDVFTGASGIVQTLSEVVTLNASDEAVVRLAVISNGALQLENDSGTLDSLGTGMNSTLLLQMAYHGRVFFVADPGQMKKYDQTEASPSLRDWLVSYYPLKVFSSGGTDYPIFRQNEQGTYYYESDGTEWPGWPEDNSGNPYGGTLYDKFGDTASDPGTATKVVITDEDVVLDYSSGSALNTYADELPSDDPLYHATNHYLVGIYKGVLPDDCHLICRYLDRIVLAGDPPHVWYMSRAGDPLDWDYSQTDTGAAISGQNSSAGTIGEPITALIPASDNFLIFGCLNSLWIMRGSPLEGGVIDNLSRRIGVVGRNAWCHGPGGDIYFLSKDGVYVISPDRFEAISRENLPEDLINIDEQTYYISLGYDTHYQGILIACRHRTDRDLSVFYWMDLRRGSFWPVTFPDYGNGSVSQPTAQCTLRGDLHIGGGTGKIRKFDGTKGRDGGADAGGTDIDSYIVYGPIRLGQPGYDGYLMTLSAVLDEDSDDVTWKLYVGDNHEEIVADAIADATPFASGTWTAGFNTLARPRARGASACIRIEQTAYNEQWAIEEVRAKIMTGSIQRTL